MNFIISIRITGIIEKDNEKEKYISYYRENYLILNKFIISNFINRACLNMNYITIYSEFPRNKAYLKMPNYIINRGIFYIP